MTVGWLLCTAAVLLAQLAALRRLQPHSGPEAPDTAAEAPQASSGPLSAPGGP